MGKLKTFRKAIIKYPKTATINYRSKAVFQENENRYYLWGKWFSFRHEIEIRMKRN